METSRDVIVIGGGWSGILACKSVKEEGLSVVVLEKRDTIGGVWYYDDDPNITTVMKSTKMTSSATVTEMSDFPMPQSMGEFPGHERVLQYLEDYCERFDLRPLIHLRTTVTEVKKCPKTGMWIVDTQDGQRYSSKYLIVCSGVHQQADLELKYSQAFREFTGTVQHSGEIKEFPTSCQGKRVLVVGGGETASDIIEDWYEHVGNIVWAIPRGQHFFRKYAKLMPWKHPQALDKASSRVLKIIAPHTKSKPGLAWVCKWTTNGSLLAYQGHGIPEWKNDAAFFHSFINKNGHVLDLVDYDKVIPKREVIGCHGNTVRFDDGTSKEIDHIILCTGYRTSFQFLPPQYGNFDFRDLYKFIFHADDSSIAFIGFVRPIVGSIPSIAELQSRLVSRVFSGKVTLPAPSDMREEILKDRRFWEEYFKGTSQRISTLVEGYTYLDDIASKAGVFPDFWKLFWTDLRGCFTSLFSPYNGCTYRLNEEEHRAQSLDTLRRHSKVCLTPLHLLLITILRVLCFDWLLDKASHLKYVIQRSVAWKSLRHNHIILKLDWLWTAPKRWLFDNTTRA